MNQDERKALAALRFNWALVPDDVWRGSLFHVDGLHDAVVQDVIDGISDAAASTDASPIGLVLEGRNGTGKTHLLGWIRQQAQQRGGYFFLISLLDGRNFWDGLLIFLLDGLARQVADGETQLQLLLRRLASRVGAPRADRRAVIGETELTRTALDAFVGGLREYDRYVAQECRDTLRALALRASENEEHQDIADNFFAVGEEVVVEERQAWGIRPKSRTSQEIVREISRLLALTGPSVIALDQLDTAVAQAALQEDLAKVSTAEVDVRLGLMATELANGLTDLRDTTRRTLTVVATLSTTWELIESRAPASFAPRFRRRMALQGIRDARVAREIIEKRFAARYATVGFTPPYPTWPVRDEVFEEARDYTPRRLLMDVDRHIRACLVDDQVRELRHLGDVPVEAPTANTPVATAPIISDDEFGRIEARFDKLRQDADVALPLERDTEDATFPALLAAGLQAWIVERGDRGARFSIDPPPSSKPDLHARLRRDLDERSEEEKENSADQSRTEDQMHWSFRAISDTHHGVGALHRIRRARTAAGLMPDLSKRKLFLLRNGAWSQSAKTQELIRQLKREGAVTLRIDENDLRVLAALHGLRDENPAHLHAWLVRYRPTEQIRLFKEALADADAWPAEDAAAPPEEPAATGFTIGRGLDDDVPVPLSPSALRKHAAIFAASGSGKTVLLRRLVEECALAGVSAIVLDSNNDLARLGDPWPQPPSTWQPGDAERAARYQADTEVLVWTPRRETGRPLSFQPLPDFAGVRDDPDDFMAAVEAAVAALAPRAHLTGRTSKVHLGLAVLRRAVEHFGRQGGRDIRGLIDLLADLPDGVSSLSGAGKIAEGLAQALTAAMDNDPMFGGSGTPMDPGTLLTPSSGKRARISVISFIGLSPDAVPGFVNQLQMSLFAFIKKNPARDRPLMGLLVMDEAQNLAPSGAMTACTQSTLVLASQARKYGLGLIFATQAPKGLHNRIPGNAATQFFGRLGSSVQIEAAREMAKVKGGDVPEIGNLTVGRFYIALEGEVPHMAQTPMCLSYHAESPLTEEEVMDRSRAEP